MYDIKKDPASESPPRFIQGAVCPTCFHPLPYPLVQPDYQADGFTFRMVQGWCFDCHHGAILLQVAGQAGKWLIHKYTRYDITDNIPVPLEGGKWTVLTPLPPAPAAAYTGTPADAPVIQTGPGGDYVYPVSESDLNKELFLLAKLLGILESCRAVVADMIFKKADKK